ncbi:hypothetical protein C1Y63_04520 [Corynebacterium sp. 13CS0277]|uniref:UvrD-helicase domain-containing protein n=1 Tax=Corynebacterium sp. 13CS0277 TaxID=2071994 RepID=UPI000D0416E3|nr:UvrD-helicase domain-containing protein [Corynebacterium sp. 13CS0277]PRQ11680.1 hypothetical protein C1Y63_04520 [Corynebacterium sp. 13CS0277]
MNSPALPDSPTPHEPARPVLSDAAARAAITHDTHTTLFVEAGAGSGKTHHLVERLLTLLIDDGVDIDNIAAITFTKKAAAELSERLHDALSEIARTGQLASRVGGPARTFADEAVARMRADAAVEKLPGAALETLHSFCQRILTRFPLEARIPPTFTVADAYTTTFRPYIVDELVEHALQLDDEDNEAGPAMATGGRFGTTYRHSTPLDVALRTLLSGGVRPRTLRALEDWMEARWSELAHVPCASTSTSDEETSEAGLRDADIDAAIAELTALRAECTSPDTDKLGVAVGDFITLLHKLRDTPMEERTIESLGNAPSGRIGSAKAWECPIEGSRAEAKQIHARLEGRITLANATHVMLLRDELVRRVPQRARDRIISGQLEHHDTLFLVDDLLHRNPEVRAELHDTYTRILIDEFQDTDPVQMRIARAITDDPATGRPTPGSLFTVGDPKQAIYRFRDADIDTYITARTELGATQQTLDTNFRSAPSVLTWINDVFAAWIDGITADQAEAAQEAADSGMPVPLQQAIDFQPLQPAPTTSNAGCGAYVLYGKNPDEGAERTAIGTIAPQVPDAEGTTVETAHNLIVRTILALQRGDTHAGGTIEGLEALDGTPRALDDMVILVDAHAKARDLMTALGAAGIPYQSEGSTLAYAGAEIEALHAVLYALAHPTDAFGTVAALRSPLLGVSDGELAAWSHAHSDPEAQPGARPWAYAHLRADDAATPAAEEHPAVTRGLIRLAGLRDDIRGMDVGSAVAFVATALNLRAVACAMEAYSDDALRRIDFVLAQARAFADAGNTSLRQYLAWVDTVHAPDAGVPVQATESARTGCVTLMTIHAAKGREFPIVFLDGLSTLTTMGGKDTYGFYRPTNSLEIKIKGFATADYDNYNAYEKAALEAERARLYYVGATRAKQLLFVPLVPPLTKTGEVYSNCKGKRLWEYLIEHPETPAAAVVATAPDTRPLAEGERAPFDPGIITRHAETTARINQLIDDAATAPRRRGVTSIAHDPHTTLVDLPGINSLPPIPGADRPEHGTDYGTALHLAMEHVDHTQADTHAAAVAAVAATGVRLNAGQRAAVIRDVELLLAEPTVQAAFAATHYREMPVLGRLPDGTAVDGVIDLLYRDEAAGGWVIADYKTDAGISAETRREYFHQLYTYAQLITEALQQPVVRLELLVLRTDSVTVQTVTL